MTPRTSLSGLGHTALCPGSASLPRVASVGPAASFGNAVHEMIARTIQGGTGVPEMLAARMGWLHDLTDAQASDLALIARTLRLPVPAGALAETPLGHFADGSVRRVVGARGEYEDAPGLLLPGTIDAMWAEPEPLWVDPEPAQRPGHLGAECQPGSTLWLIDVKTGDIENVTPVARNWQLRAGALLAARWTGATRVIPALCYVNVEGARAAAREGRVYEGEWEVGTPLGVTELQDIERDVRAVLAAAGIGGEDATDSAHVLVLRNRQEDGASLGEGGGGDLERPGEDLLGMHARGDRSAPRLVTGPHCDHCDRAAACPAWGGLVRGALGYGVEGGDPERADRHRKPVAAETGRAGLALTPAERPHVLALMLAARRFADAAQRMLRAGGPVAIHGGREYGPALEERRELDPGAALDVLAEEVGEDAALAAAEVTFASVKRAVPDAAARARVFERLEAMGAVKVTHTERWRVRHVQEVNQGAGGGPAHQGGEVGGVRARGACAHCLAEVAVNSDGRPRKHADARERDALIRKRGCQGMTLPARPLP